MNKLTRISATVASSLALVAGFSGMAFAAPSNTISNTGKNSQNWIANVDLNMTRVHNKTHVAGENSNHQTVTSGDVNANGDNNVKGATTGDASATNSFAGSVSVDNSSATSAALASPSSDSSSTTGDNTIKNTGQGSTNVDVNANVNLTSVSNDTHVWMENSSTQNVTTGDVNANCDNNVKNVSTGDATATNSSTFTVNVTN